MKPLEIRTSDADLAILNNSINIDKFPKMFEGKTKSELSYITDDNEYILM